MSGLIVGAKCWTEVEAKNREEIQKVIPEMFLEDAGIVNSGGQACSCVQKPLLSSSCSLVANSSTMKGTI